jgi:MFS family permease
MFNVIVLGIVSFLTDVSTEMSYPLLPLYLTTRLGATPAVVGLIEGIAESLASLLKVFSGYISDKVRKRKALAIFGYASSTFGKLLLYLSTSWGWVFGGRVVDRFGKGIRTSPRDALIADSIRKGRRGEAYGLHRAMDTAGATAGVILAYLFLKARSADYSSVFLLSLVPAALGVCFLLLVKERKWSIRAGRTPLDQSVVLFRWASLPVRLKAFLVVIFLFALGNSSKQFLFLRAKELGFAVQNILLLYLAYNVIYAISSYPAGLFSDIIGRKTVLLAGYLLYGIVYLGFALARSQFQIWFLFALYGLCSALTEGVEKALVADMAPLELRATSIGLHATFVSIGLLPASLLAGILWDAFGAASPFYFGGFLGLLAAFGIWFAI